MSICTSKYFFSVNILDKVFKKGPCRNLWKTAFKRFKVILPVGPCHFNFFKGCLPQILLNPFSNTLLALSHLEMCLDEILFSREL